MEIVDFFISYAKEDLRWAKWIAWQLEDNGYKCCIAAWDFIAGSNFVQEMDQATNARRILLILSPNYLKSEFVKPEWQTYFAQDPTGDKRKIFAVMVQMCEPQGLLRQVVWTDLVGLEQEKAKNTLLKNAKGERLKSLIAPPFPGPVQHTLSQEPNFPGTDYSPNPSQTLSIENDPVLISNANQRISDTFKQRPPSLSYRVWMKMVWTPMQDEEVLDPNQFMDQKFIKNVIQLARQDELPLFDETSEISKDKSLSNIVITQQHGNHQDKSHIRLVLYSAGTISIAFTGLHQSKETHTSFSSFFIDEDIVSTRLHQAAGFVSRWYNNQDPLLKYNPLFYNIGFYDVEHRRFGKTPAAHVNTFAYSNKDRSNLFLVYASPRKLLRNELQNPKELVSHAIARTALIFN